MALSLHIFPLAETDLGDVVRGIFIALMVIFALVGQITSAAKKSREQQRTVPPAQPVPTGPPSTRMERRLQQRRAQAAQYRAADPAPLGTAPPVKSLAHRPKPVPRPAKRPPLPRPLASAAPTRAALPLRPAPSMPATPTTASRIGAVLRSRQARDAIVLSEVLGPPVSLRGEDANLARG